MAVKADLSIGQVARAVGTTTSKLRYYESVGILDAPVRVSGRRMYRPDVIDMLHFIQFAQDAGFTIAEIRQLLSGFDRRTPASARWQAMARRKLRDVAALAERARRMESLLQVLLSCRCVTLSECATLCNPGSRVVRPAQRRQ